jgi:hypothetical protein
MAAESAGEQVEFMEYSVIQTCVEELVSGALRLSPAPCGLFSVVFCPVTCNLGK